LYSVIKKVGFVEVKVEMSVFSEIMPSVSPENVEEAEKIKEEANNCFRSM
jgi:hypothetical protein